MREGKTEIQIARERLLENREWFDRNIEQIQREYRGKIVAVWNKGIIFSGSTYDEVMEGIKGRCNEEETLIILVPVEDIVYVPYPS